MRGYVHPAAAVPIGLRYADDRAQDKNPGGGRRSAPARPAAALSDRAGVRRAYRFGCGGHGQAARARARRSAGARPDAPGRGRPVDLPAAARREEHHPRNHVDREGRGRGPHRRAGDGGRRLPAQTLQPARAGRAHQCGVAPPRGAPSPGRARGRTGKGQLREHDDQPRDADARARRPVDVAHHGEIRPAQGAGHEPADAPVARQIDGARPRPRIRSVRPFDRRPGVAPAQARREGSRESSLHPDRVGVRLRLRARRPAAMTLWPRSLLWRTFILLAVLVIVTTVGWFQIFRSYEREPRARQISQNLISVVNLIRTALITSQPDKRRDLLSEIAERERIQVYPSEPGERVVPLPDLPLLRLVSEAVSKALGPETRFAIEREGQAGLWVSFHIDDDEYWVRVPRERIERQIALRWLGWGALVLALSLLAAYFLVSRLNRPLRALAQAAGAIGQGKIPDPVPESGPVEIRTLSHAFNQMSKDLARLDADRALILAGVSHDLRTPLSRLRLGLEMSGADPQLREGMAADIEEMDRTINQFLDFARTDGGEPMQSADLAAIAAEVAEHYRRRGKSIATDFSGVPELPLQVMSMRRVVIAHRGTFELLPRGGGGLVARIRLPLAGQAA